jgi:2-methylaconitate cis-trans-isomerase PrpF
MLAAVAPFALLSGLIKAGAGDYEARVRIHATNTGQLIAARFRVRDGYPLVDGESRIAGVPGSGSPILLDFGDCAGSVSGKLLPTGKPRDVIEFEGRALTVSLVDAATPFVFVRASDVGATGRETPAQLAGTDLTMRLLEYARGWAAKVLGFVADHRDAATVTPNVPRVIMVSPAQEYLAVNGRSVAAREIDVCVRQLAMQKPHKALAVTGSVCTAVAARIDGTVVSELTTSRDDVLRLGHASGITGVGCSVVALPEGQYRVERAEIERTARLIMQGWLWARDSHYHELLELLRSQRPSGVVPPGQADELTRLQDAA